MLPPPPRSTLFPYTTLFRSAPIVRGRKGEFRKELDSLRTRGFTKARVDGQFRSLEDEIKLDRRKNHTIEVRSEEHTSELQSHQDLVCRLQLEKKKKT